MQKKSITLEAWKYTRQEFIDRLKAQGQFDERYERAEALLYHRMCVMDAISQGEPVSECVKADYPELF